MPRIIVADLLCLYVAHVKSRNLHGQERARKRDRLFAAFAERYGSLDVDDLRPYHMTDFIDACETWKCSGTRRCVLDILKAPFTWAAKYQRIKSNPFQAVSYEASQRRPDMPDDVLARLCDLPNKRVENVLRWLRMTACRVSELCRADWKDIDWERGVWTIPIHKTVKRTRKGRYVALVPEAVELLRSVQGAALRDSGKAEGAVFLNCRGRRWIREAIYLHIKRGKKRLGIIDPASSHGIRHRAGTAAIANGAPPKLIAHQMGITLGTLEAYYVQLDNELDAVRQAARLGLPKKG